MSRFFEDLQIGEETDLGSHLFTTEAIKAFAAKFDPQPFHLDEAAAEASIFGGLAASGWHTASVWMKLMVAYEMAETARMLAAGERPARFGPSPGFRKLRWIKPVRPGDRIRYLTRIAGRQDWPKRPAWGLVITENEGRNDAGELVFSFVGQVLIERRQPLDP